MSKTAGNLPILKIANTQAIVDAAVGMEGTGWFILEVDSNSIRKKGLMLEYARSVLFNLGFIVKTSLIQANSTPYNLARKKLSMKVKKRG